MSSVYTMFIPGFTQTGFKRIPNREETGTKQTPNRPGGLFNPFFTFVSSVFDPALV